MESMPSPHHSIIIVKSSRKKNDSPLRFPPGRLFRTYVPVSTFQRKCLLLRAARPYRLPVTFPLRKIFIEMNRKYPIKLMVPRLLQRYEPPISFRHDFPADITPQSLVGIIP